MTTRRLWLVVPITVLNLSLAACGSAKSATTNSVTAPSPVGSSAPAGSAAIPTAIAISVTVGVDDAQTLGQRVEKIPLGKPVELTMTAGKTDDSFHVHDYDLEQSAPAGKSVTFAFTADKAGDVEVESHVTDKVLVVLQIS